MPLIQPDGKVANAPLPDPPAPKTDGKRRLSNWIQAFLAFTEDAECPLCFRQWAALGALSAVAQRKISMEFKHYHTMTNQYLLLVGPPGSGKSVAIRIVRRMLKKIPGIHLSSEAPSIAGLMDDYKEITAIQADHQSLSGFMLEFSSLIENAPDSMFEFLTAFYDGDEDYVKKTRVGGKEHIPYPWLNLLGGTTPTWLGDRLSKTAIEGGFVARSIFVYSGEIVRKPLTDAMTPEEREFHEHLIHDLAYISTLRGIFRFERSAFHWFDEWRQDPKRFPPIYDNRTAGYFTRKPMHLLKVAMVVALSYKDELTITIDDLQTAQAFLEENEPRYVQALGSVGGNTYATDLHRIYAQISGAGDVGLEYSQIVAHNLHALDRRNIDATIDALKITGSIVMKISTNGNGSGLHYVGVRPPL